MSGIGFTEMLLLAVIGMIVIGPQRLPKIARTVGQLTRQARGAWQNLQSELQAEIDTDHNRAAKSGKLATDDRKHKAAAEPAPDTAPDSSTSDEHGQPGH